MKKKKINLENYNKKMKITNVNDAINIFLDDVDCNLKENNYLSCLKELDKKWFFKKRKFLYCDKLFKEVQHCITFSNESKFLKRDNYNTTLDKYNIERKYTETKIENKKDAINFIEGRISKDDLKNKPEGNVRKKIIEL